MSQPDGGAGFVDETFHDRIGHLERGSDPLSAPGTEAVGQPDFQGVGQAFLPLLYGCFNPQGSVREIVVMAHPDNQPPPAKTIGVDRSEHKSIPVFPPFGRKIAVFGIGIPRIRAAGDTEENDTDNSDNNKQSGQRIAVHPAGMAVTSVGISSVRHKLLLFLSWSRFLVFGTLGTQFRFVLGFRSLGFGGTLFA